MDKAVFLQLQLIPLFSRLTEADITDLTAGARLIAVAPETPIYEQGAYMDLFYVVLDGHVELSVERGGRRAVVEVARRGAVLGDGGLFSDQIYRMSARSLNNCTLLEIPSAAFLQKLESRFDVITHMLSAMSLRLRAQVRQISELKLKTTAQRLGNFLLFLAGDQHGKTMVRFPYDKKLVAEELGMKPESLSRALGKLARVGVDSMADNTVLIADVDRLRDFCVEDEDA